jgi:ankyrin repeat protein
MIKNYRQFVDSRSRHDIESVYENMKQAAAYLSLNKIPVEDQGFQQIRKLLADQTDAKLAYAFTKFYYEDLKDLSDADKIQELKDLLAKLKRYRSALDRLPMPVERYVSKAANDEELATYEEKGRAEPRGALERLTDDLISLEGDIILTKWRSRLISWQKAWFDNFTEFQMKRVKNIAIAFDQFGMEEDGTKDLAANEALQRMFFSKLKDYKTATDLIVAAEGYVKSAASAGFKKFMIAMEKVNKKYGEMNGAEQVWSDGSKLIIEVKSFAANKDLNGNTSHCIVRGIGSWETYVGLDKYTKQYYIYDFDLPPSDNHSVIGITIAPKGVIRACHLKDDANFSSQIANYLKKKGIDMSILKPLSEEEVEQRKRKIEASKEIIKPSITLETAKKLIEDGADPNSAMGRPLENAVKEDNHEKVLYLLSVGAAPNINNPMKYAKNFEMIKILVTHDTQITNEAFASCCSDLEAVEFLIDNGVDPNFEQGFPLRTAVRGKNIEVIELLIEKGAKISERRYMAVKTSIECGASDIFKLFLEKLSESDNDFKNNATREKLLNEWKNWNNASRKTEQSIKTEIDEIIESFR